MKKFSKPNFYSIKSQLTVWIALQILIPVFFISIFSTALSVRFSNRQAVNYARDLLAVIRKEFESKRDEIFKVSQELLYDENIFDSMLMLDPELLNESRLRSTLFSVCLSHPEIDAVGLEVDGRYIKSEKHRGHLFNYDSIIYRDLLAQIEADGGEELWYVKSHDDSAPSITLIRALYHPYSGKRCGALMLSVNANRLFSSISGYDTDGMYTFSAVTTENALAENAAFDMENGIFRQNKSINIFTTVSNMDLKLVCRINENSLYSNGYNIFRYLCILSGFSVLLLLLFIYHTNTQLIGPLSDFITSMNTWQEGKQTESRYEDRNDEIGELFRTFSKMCSRINNLIDKNYRAEITKNIAEIKMLQSQINPHFLFNTLDSVNCMAQINDVPEISRMITALSDIIGQTLSRDSELIPLSKELGYVENYLYILKVRFGDKISFILNAAPDTMEVLIPPLIIQPIIENSFKHSISKTKKSCTLVLETRIEDGALLIDVTDDGPGISDEQLRTLNGIFAADEGSLPPPGADGHGIGLGNVSRRLKLMCGSESGIFIKHSKDGNTVVHIIVKPIHRGDLSDV